MLSEHLDIAESIEHAPYGLHHEQDAKRDVQRLKQYLIQCPKRRAHREGTIPPEVLLLLLAPNWRVATKEHGLGFHLQSDANDFAPGAAKHTTFVRGGLLQEEVQADSAQLPKVEVTVPSSPECEEPEDEDPFNFGHLDLDNVSAHCPATSHAASLGGTPAFMPPTCKLSSSGLATSCDLDYCTFQDPSLGGTFASMPFSCKPNATDNCSENHIFQDPNLGGTFSSMPFSCKLTLSGLATNCFSEGAPPQVFAIPASELEDGVGASVFSGLGGGGAAQLVLPGFSVLPPPLSPSR